MLEEGIDLKLKSKIYLFQFFFSTVLLGFIFFTYKNYEVQYKNDLEVYINDKTEFYKQQFVSSYNEAFYKFDKKRELFRLIHTKAIDILKNQPNIKLNLLADKLIKEFNLKDILIDIYMIDKNYIIYKTTYPKDLGFNLSIIKEAKEFLDKTTKDKKIYIADFISTDPLNMEYRLYSYSYLSRYNYLELGFKDRDVFNNFKKIIGKHLENSTSQQLYNITKTKKQYIYYPFSQNRSLSKEDFFKTVKKVKIDATNYDDILKSYIQKNTIIEYQDNFAVVSTPLFDKDIIKKIGYNNIVLKVKIDISSKLEALKEYKNIFYISIFTTLLFLFVIHILIDRYFTIPVEKILSSIKQKKDVDDNKILCKNDELAIIAKNYNNLLSSLNKEIVINKTLLDENKRFITDTVHQIRTPLTNIMMNSEMIKRVQKSEESENFIDQISASINMLTNSYEDLSYIISYDSIDYNPAHINVSYILSQRIKFFGTISKVNFKEIIADVQKDIFFDINQIELERLIDNNISNAIKYADIHKPMSITLLKQAKTIKLEFKTYGKAIKNPKKLFDKNYRENKSKRGLGLGLNMVKNICQKYDIEYKVTYEDTQNMFTYLFKG